MSQLTEITQFISGQPLRAILWNFSTAGNSYSAAINLPSSTEGYYQISHVNATSSVPDLVAQGTVSSLASQPINVTFSQFDSYLVQTGPVQFTPPGLLSFSAQQNGANPVSQDIVIAYNGTSPSAPFSVTSNASWLTVATASGSGNGQVLRNTVDISGLTSGDYVATVSVKRAGLDTSEYEVNLSVSAPPLNGTTIFATQTPRSRKR